MESKEHEETLQVVKNAFEMQNKKVVLLHGRIPDGIVAYVENGVIKLDAFDAVKKDAADYKARVRTKQKYTELGFDKVIIFPFYDQLHNPFYKKKKTNLDPIVIENDISTS